jgi:hypothetical protein
MLKISLKPGDTLALQGQALTNGLPQDLTGWGIRSSVKADGVWIADTVVIFLNRLTGTYRLSYDGTANWTSKRIFIDIQYTSSSGQKMSTESIQIVMIDGQTGSSP